MYFIVYFVFMDLCFGNVLCNDMFGCNIMCLLMFRVVNSFACFDFRYNYFMNCFVMVM